MVTYQDLLDCGQDEKKRTEFILSAIEDHKRSDLYKTAVNAKLYYSGENPTINRYEKVLYDLAGMPHMDTISANHKLASSFFGFSVDQLNGYLLGNGVTFKNNAIKKRLGRGIDPFDQQVMRAGEYAQIGGVSFGFWNLDHIDVFNVTEFVPLYDEENGALAAGIRFWQLSDSKPLRCTLYELDGLTEYSRPKGKTLEERFEKRPYILHKVTTELDGTRIYDGENYPSFPIVPLKNNEDSDSELVGKRNTIDALDFACSNMVNGVDEGNIIYWAIKGAGGMDDADLAKFVERVKTLRVAQTPEDVEADPHAIEAPFNGTQATIDMLKRKLYEDFQCFDSSAVSAGNQTATAIKASYAPLDLKADKFERQVTRFIKGILELAGIDDEPSYTRNQIVNKMEEMQTLMLMAPHVDAEYVTTKALTIMGDADMAEEIMKRMAAEELGRMDGVEDETPDGEEEENEMR